MHMVSARVKFIASYSPSAALQTISALSFVEQTQSWLICACSRRCSSTTAQIPSSVRATCKALDECHAAASRPDRTVLTALTLTEVEFFASSKTLRARH